MFLCGTTKKHNNIYGKNVLVKTRFLPSKFGENILPGNACKHSLPGFPRTLQNSGKRPFRGKSEKSQGICQAPQGNLENSEISGDSQGISAMADLSAVT